MPHFPIRRMLLPTAVVTVLVGCGTILGLDDRSLDESSLDPDGYAGCVPGDRCDGCITDDHRRDCEVSTSAGGSLGAGGSGGSAGGSGGAGGSTSDSSTDSGGSAGTGGSPSSGGSSATSSGGATSASGGSTSSGGASNTSSTSGAPNLFGCGDPGIDACDDCVCASCDSSIRQCEQDQGCGNIWSCFGNRECSPVEGDPDSCFGPGMCLPAINDNGGLNGASVAAVRALIDCALNECACAQARCTSEGGCECDTCEEKCVCEGGSDSECSAQCGATPPEPCGTNGNCDNCSNCLSQCICGGTSQDDCIDQCGISTCQDSCGTCQTSVEQCLCEGILAPEDCFQQQTGLSCGDYYQGLAYEACYSCACQECPALVSLCEADPDYFCPSILDCMSNTGCVGNQCNAADTCNWAIAPAAGGMNSVAAQLAEGIIACRQEHQCQGCPVPPPPPVYCNGFECYSYVPPDPNAPNAPACCGGMNQDLCGFELDAYWPAPADDGMICVPSWQPGTTQVSCPGAETTHPFHSMWLNGCCRSNGSCGLEEVQIGLGCVPPEVVGLPMSAQSCTP